MAMFVLCSLAVLTLHSLFRSWSQQELCGEESRRASGSTGGGGDPARRRGDVVRNVPASREGVQVREWRSGHRSVTGFSCCTLTEPSDHFTVRRHHHEKFRLRSVGSVLNRLDR